MTNPVVITGASGTIGTELVDALRRLGIPAVGWNRQEVPPLHASAAAAYLDRIQPRYLFSLAVASQPTGIEDEGWRINADWPGQLAELCSQRGIGFLQTSTVMVYADTTKGPITPATEPNADTGYGYQKLCSEQYVQQAHPDALIVRIGWQIGLNGGNSMINRLDQLMAQDGRIDASTAWMPAVSFIPDTVAAMLQLAGLGGSPAAAPGVYLLDSNQRWNFAEIVHGLAAALGRDWRVHENTDFVFDQRMQDPRITLPGLDARLPQLAT
ncbi:sugar nucleotide-binding protein [Spirochaeta africana]|uniref:dTDP-4-dehydrorhamnose reductase n=1 Tax=Spirochaeta africana (strain ATCC 700263 / DSM 8902 / Z-7692) TaxID=889378 RepID=H9UFC5_SPIAZ|nr:sugar nucleotide-binding protein [Spirochaeta africana]AFG36218.1 dTDP-4-dehydrorhamnose reductase [Spirochaeta africana DSM 8902]